MFFGPAIKKAEQVQELYHLARGLLAHEAVEWCLGLGFSLDEEEDLVPLRLVEGNEHEVEIVYAPVVVHNHPRSDRAWPSWRDVSTLLRVHPLVQECWILSGDGRHYCRLWLEPPSEEMSLLTDFPISLHRPPEPRDLEALRLGWEIGWEFEGDFQAAPGGYF